MNSRSTAAWGHLVLSAFGWAAMEALHAHWVILFLSGAYAGFAISLKTTLDRLNRELRRRGRGQP